MERLTKFHMPINGKEKIIGRNADGSPKKKMVWFVKFDDALEAVAMHVYHINDSALSKKEEQVEGAWPDEWAIVSKWFKRQWKKCMRKNEFLLRRAESGQTALSGGSKQSNNSEAELSTTFSLDQWFAMVTIENFYLTRRSKGLQRKPSLSALLSQSGVPVPSALNTDVEMKRASSISSSMSDEI